MIDLQTSEEYGALLSEPYTSRNNNNAGSPRRHFEPMTSARTNVVNVTDAAMRAVAGRLQGCAQMRVGDNRSRRTGRSKSAGVKKTSVYGKTSPRFSMTSFSLPGFGCYAELPFDDPRRQMFDTSRPSSPFSVHGSSKRRPPTIKVQRTDRWLASGRDVYTDDLRTRRPKSAGVCLSQKGAVRSRPTSTANRLLRWVTSYFLHVNEWSVL